jgi:hypothetical protein
VVAEEKAEKRQRQVAYQLGFKRQPRETLIVQSWHKRVGYMPYYGPDIAAFNPTQLAAFNSNIGAAEAFGMVPQGSLTAMQGMAPEATTYAGGLQAYSSGNLFDQALAELESRRPGQFAQYNKMFVNPFTGEDPTPVVAPTQQVARMATPSWRNPATAHLPGFNSHNS